MLKTMHFQFMSFIPTSVSKSGSDRVGRVVSILSPGLVNLPLLRLPILVKSLHMELKDLLLVF